MKLRSWQTIDPFLLVPTPRKSQWVSSISKHVDALSQVPQESLQTSTTFVEHEGRCGAEVQGWDLWHILMEHYWVSEHPLNIHGF